MGLSFKELIETKEGKYIVVGFIFFLVLIFIFIVSLRYSYARGMVAACENSGLDLTIEHKIYKCINLSFNLMGGQDTIGYNKVNNNISQESYDKVTKPPMILIKENEENTASQKRGQNNSNPIY